MWSLEILTLQKVENPCAVRTLGKQIQYIILAREQAVLNETLFLLC